MENTGLYASLIRSRHYLIFELLGIFIILPAMLYALLPIPIIPILWMISFLTLWALFKDKTFDRDSLWRLPELKINYRSMFKQFTLIAAVMIALVYLFIPDLLFQAAYLGPGSIIDKGEIKFHFQHFFRPESNFNECLQHGIEEVFMDILLE